MMCEKLKDLYRVYDWRRIMQEKKTVYLAGKITGDPYYRSKFYKAAQELEKDGFIVLSPAILPSEGFTYEAYIRMSRAMLDECPVACFLPDWIQSDGAMAEYGRAVAQGKEIFFYSERVSKRAE